MSLFSLLLCLFFLFQLLVVGLQLIWVQRIGSTVIGKIYRSSHPEVFLEKGALKIWSNFTGIHSCRSALQLY